MLTKDELCDMVSTDTVEVLDRAIKFATIAHEGQVRKYTGEPYITHPIEVACTVATVQHTTAMLVAAVLHDTVEDTDVTLEDIEREFGAEVRELVYWLTDKSRPEDGNRATRKAIDRAHLAQAPPQAQTVKLCDLLSNTRSITEHDREFAKVYINEKRQLLEVMNRGDSQVYLAAMFLCEVAINNLAE